MFALFLDDLPNAVDKGSRIEFAADDLVGTIGKHSDPPVAGEGNQLVWLCGFDLRAELLGGWYAALAFDIDEHEVVRACSQHWNGFHRLQCGIDMKA